MKTVDEIRDILGKHKEELADRYKIKEIGLFGSYIRGSAASHNWWKFDLAISYLCSS